MVLLVAGFLFVNLLFLALSLNADKKINLAPIKKLQKYPQVSIIIPSFKSGKKLAKTLASIRAIDYPKKEVIVVNDGTDMDVASVCKTFGAREIQNVKRMGKGVSLNKGVKYAKGEFILFLDSDTILNNDTLRTLLSSYNNHKKSNDNIGMIAPAYTAKNKKNIFSRFSDFEQAMHQNIIKMQMNFRSILSTRGCCLLLTKEVFRKAGGFSKTLIEDGDFAAKVFKAGYAIKYEPRALVKTGEPETFKSLLRSKRRYGKGTFYCAIKHIKPYLNSPQAFICFYPFPILTFAFLGLYFFHSLFHLPPFLIYLATLTFNGTTSFLYTGLSIIILSAASSAIGNMVSNNTNNSSGLLSQATSFTIFSVLFVPVAYAYLRGALSGIADKIRRKPELILSDW